MGEKLNMSPSLPALEISRRAASASTLHARASAIRVGDAFCAQSRAKGYIRLARAGAPPEAFPPSFSAGSEAFMTSPSVWGALASYLVYILIAVAQAGYTLVA
jgi:hypothetical protein